MAHNREIRKIVAAQELKEEVALEKGDFLLVSWYILITHVWLYFDFFNEKLDTDQRSLL